MQCVAKSEPRIDIVRVLKPILTESNDFNPEILEEKERYFIKIILVAASDMGLIKFIGCFDVPKSVKLPANFRTLEYNPYKGWRKWYEIDERIHSRKQVTLLDKHFLSLSSYGVWNVALLKDRIESGWSLENWK